MDKILKELENTKEIAKMLKENEDDKSKISQEEKVVRELQEKVKLQMMDTREFVKAEYDKKKEELDKHKKENTEKYAETNEKFESAKKAILEQIDSELKTYTVRTKQERLDMIKKLEDQKSVYTKLAVNNSEELKKLLEKVNSGEFSYATRLASVQSEYRENSENVLKLEEKIKDASKIKSIEENIEQFSDLKYLKTRISGMRLDDIEKLEKDEFVKKYGKEVDPEQKSQPKPEQKMNIVVDVTGNHVYVNGEKIENTYYTEKREGKEKNINDAELAIGSKFISDKKAMKNIDWALLSVLKQTNKEMAEEYLNIIRGGGAKDIEKSVEDFKNKINLTYKYVRSQGSIFGNFTNRKVAKFAKNIGIAELDGISEKSLFENLKDMFSRISRTKKLGSGKKEKEKIDNDGNKIENVEQYKKDEYEKLTNSEYMKNLDGKYEKALKRKQIIKNLRKIISKKTMKRKIKKDNSKKSVKKIDSKQKKAKTIELINQARRKEGIRQEVKVDNTGNKIEKAAQQKEDSQKIEEALEKEQQAKRMQDVNNYR